MLRIILIQLITTVVVACVAGGLGGMSALWSALFGGLCCALPNSLFALRLHMSTRKPGGANPMTFFFGEFIKIATTIALMGVVVWLYRDVNWLAFLLSFIAVLKSYIILLFKPRP
ncbi:MAG: synthase [Herbaspirillum sp.]|jgi:ATP synthase protein I|nr:synthase [Herbaspirillum sp.]